MRGAIEVLSVYGLTCNDLVDPMGTGAPFLLRWRLGSDIEGADQAAYRVRVTSLESGDALLDTGWVTSSDNGALFSGEGLEAGGLAVWFVEVRDEAGNQACSPPACFQKVSFQGAAEPQDGFCHAVFACSDPCLDATYYDRSLAFLCEDPRWSRLLGLTLDGTDGRGVRMEPRLPDGLSFVRASLMAPRGLVVESVRRHGAQELLEVSLAPGMRAQVLFGGAEWELSCGHHVLKSPS